MKPISNLKAIVFDLDDTLCGYWDASKAALREAFEMHPVDGIAPEEMVMQWASAFREFSPTLKQTGWYEGYLKEGGPTRVEQMRLTLLRIGLDNPELAVTLSDHYGMARNRNLALFPEALEVIETLGKKFPLGVLTNGPADIQRQEVEKLELAKHFKGIYIEGEMGLGKPHRQVFDKIAADFGAEPQEMLMVGNSYAHDVRPALEAGWHAIWVRRPSDVPPSAKGIGSKPEEKPENSPEPNATIGDLREMLALVE